MVFRRHRVVEEPQKENTMSTIAFGHSLTDAELAEFSGGYCTVTITRDANGKVTKVETSGPSCGNVSVVVQA